MSHVFYYDSGEVHVESIPEPDLKYLENNGPYRCTIIPDDPLLPTEVIEKDEKAGHLAAMEALWEYKEKHHLNPSTVWNLS